jgi:hypothetical protein
MGLGVGPGYRGQARSKADQARLRRALMPQALPPGIAGVYLSDKAV